MLTWETTHPYAPKINFQTLHVNYLKRRTLNPWTVIQPDSH
jgi:hypothetical protein